MEHIVFEKKNLGLIALFLVLIAAVVLLTTEEEHEEEMPLPDVKLTEIMPHSTQPNADGKALGFITLTNQTEETVDLSGWGLADRAYKVKYVFEIGTTLADGENLTVYLAGKHGASGAQRYALGFLLITRNTCICTRRMDARATRLSCPRWGRTAHIGVWMEHGSSMRRRMRKRRKQNKN